jgi:hypothetical protein
MAHCYPFGRSGARVIPGYMEIGAFFILVLVVIVVAIGGAVVWAIAGRLRRGQLDPEGDTTEPAPESGGRRPTHRRASSEQQAEFVPPR